MKTALAFLVLLVAIPAASARPNIFKRTAVAYGRAGKNLVTWKNKTAAIQGLLVIGAITADFVSTEDVLHRCSTCYEENPIFGRHPSGIHMFAIGAPIAATEVTLDYALAEKADTKGRYAFTWGAVGGIAALHSWLAGHNLNLVRQCQLARLEGCQ